MRNIEKEKSGDYFEEKTDKKLVSDKEPNEKSVLELIDELCHDGVEYRKVKEVFNIKRGRVISKKYIRDNPGNYPVYSSQTEKNGELGKISTYDQNGEYLTWTTDGAYAGTIFYRKGKFTITNVCGLMECINKSQNIKFFYHYLKMVSKEYVNQGMGNPKLMSNVMAEIEIPVPPLEVQRKIAEMLDAFSENTEGLQRNLTKELELRKKQYEYYRDDLLRFPEGSIEYLKLNEIAQIYDGTHQTPEYTKEGIPFVSVENIQNIYESQKYISKEAYDKYKIKPEINDIFMTRIGSIGKCAIYDKEQDLAYYVSLALIRPNSNKVNSMYLKQVIESTIGKKELDKYTLHYAIPIKINKNDIGNIRIPIPSMEKQNKLADILEKFEKLTQSVSEEIPAEIEGRKKQYEYYRDKLLNFKRKADKK